MLTYILDNSTYIATVLLALCYFRMLYLGRVIIALRKPLPAPIFKSCSGCTHNPEPSCVLYCPKLQGYSNWDRNDIKMTEGLYYCSATHTKWTSNPDRADRMCVHDATIRAASYEKWGGKAVVMEMITKPLCTCTPDRIKQAMEIK